MTLYNIINNNIDLKKDDYKGLQCYCEATHCEYNILSTDVNKSNNYILTEI